MLKKAINGWVGKSGGKPVSETADDDEGTSTSSRPRCDLDAMTFAVAAKGAGATETMEERIQSGISRLRGIQECLDGFQAIGDAPLIRDQNQRMFHEAMLKACLPRIFGVALWKIKEMEIKKRLGMGKERHNPNLVISTPRRNGKTAATAMFAAAVLYSVPGTRIVTYATNQRTASALMMIVKDFYMQIKPRSGVIAVNSMEAFVISPDGDPGNPMRASVQALPSSSSGTRGISPHIVIIDEAGHVPDALMMDTVFPLMMVEGVVVMAVSTPPMNDEQVFLEMFEVTNTKGERFFKGIQIATVCKPCSNKKITDCPHMPNTRPQWLSPQAIADLEKLYALQPGRYMREMQGEHTSEFIEVFPKKYVDALFSKPRIEFASNFNPEVIFVSIDPSGGGRSMSAFTAHTWDRENRLILLGLKQVSMASTDGLAEQKALKSFVNALKTVADAQYAHFVFIIEANLSKVRVNDLARAIYGWDEEQHTVMRTLETGAPPASSGGHQKDFGVWVTADGKEAMQQQTNAFLRADRVFIAEDVQASETDLLVFREQFTHFKRVFKTVANPAFQKASYSYSGKTSSGRNDDMLMALMMGLVMSRYYMSSINLVYELPYPRREISLPPHVLQPDSFKVDAEAIRKAQKKRAEEQKKRDLTDPSFYPWGHKWQREIRPVPAKAPVSSVAPASKRQKPETRSFPTLKSLFKSGIELKDPVYPSPYTSLQGVYFKPKQN